MVKTIYRSDMSRGLPFLAESSVYFPCVKLLVWKVTGSNLWQNLFHENIFIMGEISTSMKNFFHRDFYTSFKQTAHPSNFENKSCLLSKLFHTGKVQTKAKTTERNMRCKGSNSKSLF